MAEPVVIWGGGAVGGVFAGHLARAGRDVLIVDTDSAHVAQIVNHGLRVDLPGGGFTAHPAACHPDDVTGRFETVFLAVKAHITGIAGRGIAAHLSPGGVVVSLQNGLCEWELADILGENRVLGAFINFGGDIIGPGHVAMGNRGAVVVGGIDGAPHRDTARILDLLRQFEPDAISTDNIWGFLWAKQAYAAVLKASGLSDGTMVEYLTDPASRAVNGGLIREILAVARAEGITPMGFDGFDPATFAGADDSGLDQLAQFWAGSSKTHSGAWCDLEVPGRRTDSAAQLAPVLAAATRHGMSVPLTRALVALIGEIESGQARQSAQMVQRLQQVSHAA
ncbi:ketopantoate reductase family protein [Oceaniglobus ichthyenteri]|uniref:ketopantoate reductase family protein n=1 Tax=Oceaniglobus ichthyenteri TaxID=2136177 RepID=UPI000D3CFAB6|nr:2-dehydropantoate 2-reductase N-terminal domain-containing protein [Oceaniglobus ichthyenteri]